MNAGRCRRAIGIVTGTLALCGTPVARAQDRPSTSASAPASTPATPASKPPGDLALVWRAPTSCPTSADIEARFDHLVGTLTKHLEATAIVEATAAGTWNLELSTVLEGSAGHRVLSGDSCAAVAEAAALILAMMIDPAAAERAATPAPPPPPPPPPAAPALVVVATTTGLPPGTLRPYARAFAGFLFDALPRTTGAAGLAAGAARGHFAAEVTFLASREARATLPANAGAGSFRLITGGVRGCGRLGNQAFVAQACLGGEVSRITGQGLGVDSVNARTALVGAGTADVSFVLPVVGPLALTLDFVGAGHPYRPTFFITDRGDLWRVPGLSVFAGLGLLVII